MKVNYSVALLLGIAGFQTALAQDVKVFSHVALLPASADPASIRFEKIEATKRPTVIKYTSDRVYCQQLSEPGGSQYCPREEREAFVPVYEVTYSFVGPTDFSGNRNSSFQVYFRPEEVPLTVKDAIANHRVKRDQAREYFQVSAQHEKVQGLVTDQEKSNFCAGSFVDGNWTQTDDKCQETVAYKVGNTVAENLSVRVEAIPVPSVIAGNRK